MESLSEKIYSELKVGNNLLLVGPTNSGKTWYAKKELILFLKKNKFTPVYFHNPDDMNKIPDDIKVVVIDEFETLLDRDYLEQLNGQKGKYYSENYIEKVKKWHEKVKKIRRPVVLILTRNKDEEIKYILNNIKETDWGTPVKPLQFYRNGISRHI